jgi:hypothetical protein
MAASATSVKELNVLKQCCNPLNVSHRTISKKNLRPVLDWMIKKFLVFRKDKESVINVGKLLQICLKALKMKSLALQAPNMT